MRVLTEWWEAARVAGFIFIAVTVALVLEQYAARWMFGAWSVSCIAYGLYWLCKREEYKHLLDRLKER